MALQVVSHAVSIYRVTGVSDGAEQTQEYTFKRGELLPEWVSPHQQFVLSSMGYARQVGDFPDTTLRAAEDMPAPVILPEHNPLAVMGSGVVAPMAVTERVTLADRAAGREGSDPEGLPAEGDTKPEWERAAVRLGVPRGEAEAMRKADLVKETRKRHDAKQAEAKKAEAREQERKDEEPPRTFAPSTRATGQPSAVPAKAAEPPKAGTPKAGA